MVKRHKTEKPRVMLKLNAPPPLPPNVKTYNEMHVKSVINGLHYYRYCFLLLLLLLLLLSFILLVLLLLLNITIITIIIIIIIIIQISTIDNSVL